MYKGESLDNFPRFPVDQYFSASDFQAQITTYVYDDLNHCTTFVRA